LFDSGSNADDVWRENLSQKGEWLASTTWHNLTRLEDLVTTFPAVSAQGVVLYDPAVPATSNLASTAAGCEDLLPVAYRPNSNNSVYHRLVVEGPKLHVALNLVGLFSNAAQQGITSKIAAYRWGRDRWLQPGVANPANPAKIGYYVDYYAAAVGDQLKAAPGLTQVSNHLFRFPSSLLL